MNKLLAIMVGVGLATVGSVWAGNESALAKENGNSERPNIVFIFADDWGWGDLGCYGHQVAKTPNLDRLAKQGTRFTQFYVASGVCSPSRTAVVTGQCPARQRVHGHFADHKSNAKRGMPDWLDPNVPNYMNTLHKAGYKIGHFGKWHLGGGDGAPEPFAYGVDDCRINVGNGPQLEFSRKEFLDEVRNQSSEFIKMRSRGSEYIVNHALDFIDANKDEPFLVNVWLNDSHAILAPTDEQMARYKRQMPDFVSDRFPGALATYYAVLTEADRQVGRLLKHLDELGLADNTIVIFSSDNGPEDISSRQASHSGVGSSGPFRGRKRSLYEGGVRVPFILRWPAGGLTAGTVDNITPLSALDLFPTFCTLAGAPMPEKVRLDGEDMSDVFRGAQRERKTPLFWEWRFRVHGHSINKSPILAIRKGEWKLLMNPDRSRVELFNISANPMEVDNVAAQHPEIVERLTEEVMNWQLGLPKGPIEKAAGSNAYPWPKPYRASNR